MKTRTKSLLSGVLGLVGCTAQPPQVTVPTLAPLVDSIPNNLNIKFYIDATESMEGFASCAAQVTGYQDLLKTLEDTVPILNSTPQVNKYRFGSRGKVARVSGLLNVSARLWRFLPEFAPEAPFLTIFKAEQIEKDNQRRSFLIGKQVGIGSPTQVKLETEPKAVDLFFNHHDRVSMTATICIDIGGGTSDISVWSRSNLLLQSSTPFANPSTMLLLSEDLNTIFLHRKDPKNFYLELDSYLWSKRDQRGANEGDRNDLLDQLRRNMDDQNLNDPLYGLLHSITLYGEMPILRLYDEYGYFYGVRDHHYYLIFPVPIKSISPPWFRFIFNVEGEGNKFSRLDQPACFYLEDEKIIKLIEVGFLHENKCFNTFIDSTFL